MRHGRADAAFPRAAGREHLTLRRRGRENLARNTVKGPGLHPQPGPFCLETGRTLRGGHPTFGQPMTKIPSKRRWQAGCCPRGLAVPSDESTEGIEVKLINTVRDSLARPERESAWPGFFHPRRCRTMHDLLPVGLHPLRGADSLAHLAGENVHRLKTNGIARQPGRPKVSAAISRNA
jgi:hypothetical protein